MNQSVVEIFVEMTPAAEKICPFDRLPIEWMQKFFPPGFDFIAEAQAVGVKTIRAAGLPPGLAGGYIADTKEIIIAPGIDWEDLAARIERDFPGLGVTTAENARAFMFLHEIGHAMQGENATKGRLTSHDLYNFGAKPLTTDELIAIRDSSQATGDQLSFINVWILVNKREDEANEFAAGRFLEWRISMKSKKEAR